MASTPLIPARRRLLAACAVSGFAAAFAAPARAAVTGSGTAATETRAVAGFGAISMRGDIDVVVRQTGRESVQVTTDDNLLPLLETVVDDRTLRIQWKRGETVRHRARTQVTVEVVRLEAVSSAGSGDLRLEGLATPSLALSIAGSGDAQARQLDVAGALKLSLAGSGDAQLAGKAGRLEISIAGSGDVDATALSVEQASVSIAGSGDAEVTASKSVAVSIAGSGDVRYGGGATLAASRVAGSGRVRLRH